jgi:hypothetical protein
MSVHAESAADAAVSGVPERTQGAFTGRRVRPSLVGFGLFMVVQFAWVAALIYGTYRVIGFVGGIG